MKRLLVVLAIALTLLASKPRVIAISAAAQSNTKPIAHTTYVGQHFSQFQIDKMLGLYADDNFTVLRKIIKCESRNTITEGIDSNGKMSRGILQFQDQTFATFAPLAGVTSSAMDPIGAVKTADWMINHGEIGRWTCAHLLKLL